MRNKKRLEKRKILIPLVITILFILFLVMSALVNAQEKQLIIDVVSEVFEEADFTVSVYTINENDSPVYQIDVVIEFNNESYNITNENPEITITAPDISESKFFNIEASKIGYETAVTNIFIVKQENPEIKQLIITLLDDDFIIDGGDYFSVLITNKTGYPISDVIIGIQSYTDEGSVGITDVNGRARLIAPEDRSEIILIAQKEGYVDGTEKIWVHANPGLIESIIRNPFAPILIAILVLFLAILFVNLRQKRKKYPEENTIGFSKQSSNDHLYNKKNSFKDSERDNEKISYKQIPDEDNQVNSNLGAKVEEIRISRPKKTKNIVSVENEEKKNFSSFKSRKKIGDNWFEGTDDIMYEIDKITGKIDEEGRDKWFEGTDNIRAKIDKKLKMKDKKKDN
jgi:hypothetical protein